MSSPFYYLKNVPFYLSDWRTSIDDFDRQQSVIDYGAKLLSDVSKDFFLKHQITPYYGIIWSWPKNQNQSMTYHTDADKDENGKVHITDYCSINFLLDGDGGITEFVSMESTKEVGDIFRNQQIKLNYRLFENVTPEYRAFISYDSPIMMRTDMPHRVNTTNIEKTRWTYSLRFYIREETRTRKAQWADLKSALNDYIC